MNEVMMVPVQEFNRLQDYYKGQITQNALLNKAGRLAAEEHLILKDGRIPDSMAVKMTKPIATEESKLVKRIRTGTRGPISYQGTTEPEGMADAPVENLLKQIIKGVNKQPAARAPVIIKKEAATPSTSGLKKELKTPKPPIPPKPSTSKKPPTPPKPATLGKKGRSLKKKVLSEAQKGFLRSIGVAEKYIDDDGGYSPKGKAKKYKKAKKTEAEKLQEGWEDFEPWRKGLSYDSD